MKYQLLKSVVIAVLFNEQEFQLLDASIRQNSEYKHYAEPGPGSFWNAYRNSHLHVKDLEPQNFSFRQLDLLSKILETPMNFQKNKQASDLYFRIGALLRSVNDMAVDLNKDIQTISIGEPEPSNEVAGGLVGSFHRATPESSNVEFIAYDVDTKIFSIGFKRDGAIYDYHRVNQEDATRAYNSESYGNLVRNELMGYQGVKRVTEDDF